MMILDSRPVHAARPHSEAIRDAQRKKPKVPVHAVLTATNPLIRFIGSDDMTQNRELFQVWLQKLAQWHQTTTPYLFLHTPDIAQAPELVHTLWEDLRKTLPEIGKRAARTVLTGMCYSVGSATRQGSSSPTRFIGQSAMTSRT